MHMRIANIKEHEPPKSKLIQLHMTRTLYYGNKNHIRPQRHLPK